MKYFIVLVVLAGLLAGINAAYADEELRYNQVRLQSQQTEAVSNDTMHVTMNTYAEMQDPAKLAEAINKDMEWALQQAKLVKDVRINTGSYQTWPITRKEVTTGWRGQQDLVMESCDTEILSRLVARLQDRLQITSMSFTVSDEKQMEVENRLIGTALTAFKERAGIIGDNLEATGFRIVEININTSTQRPPMLRQAKMSAMSIEASDAVAVEGGESDVRVSVNGTIELQIP